MGINFGIDVVKKNSSLIKAWGTFALLANQSSLDKNLLESKIILKNLAPKEFKLILSPQHGYYCTEQDNMLETDNDKDIQTGVPVFSLYSSVRSPSEGALEGVDTIVVDIQIVGCRVYTFKATINNCLMVAKKLGKKVVILDRPNPLGGEVIEGCVLEEDMKSFVGPFPMPMRHGLCVSEMALMLNSRIGAELDIVPMEGWKPSQYWSDLNRPWIFTSPNLPDFSNVLLYPGLVLLEGCNISEGRGTTRPFLLIGSSHATDPQGLVDSIEKDHVSQGILIRPIKFKPCFNKDKDKVCQGLHIMVKDPKKIRSFKFTLSLIKAFSNSMNGNFKWTSPPYEYEYDKVPIDVIMGRKNFHKDFFEAKNFDDFCFKDLDSYKKIVKPFLRYEREMIL